MTHLLCCHRFDIWPVGCIQQRVLKPGLDRWMVQIKLYFLRQDMMPKKEETRKTPCCRRVSHRSPGIRERRDDGSFNPNRGNERNRIRVQKGCNADSQGIVWYPRGYPRVSQGNPFVFLRGHSAEDRTKSDCQNGRLVTGVTCPLAL
jgi:hypothetical protein